MLPRVFITYHATGTLKLILCALKFMSHKFNNVKKLKLKKKKTHKHNQIHLYAEVEVGGETAGNKKLIKKKRRKITLQKYVFTLFKHTFISLKIQFRLHEVGKFAEKFRKRRRNVVSGIGGISFEWKTNI